MLSSSEVEVIVWERSGDPDELDARLDIHQGALLRLFARVETPGVKLEWVSYDYSPPEPEEGQEARGVGVVVKAAVAWTGSDRPPNIVAREMVIELMRDHYDAIAAQVASEEGTAARLLRAVRTSERGKWVYPSAVVRKPRGEVSSSS
jgi:hypothetical protein